MHQYEELVVKVVDLKGSYYQMGLQQSEEIRSSSKLEQQALLQSMTKTSNAQKAQQIFQDVSPNLLHELEGLATGLQMPLDTVVKMYSGYNISFPTMGCTAFVQSGNYVRNYDFSPKIYDARLVFSKPTHGYASVGFSQQIIGRLDGMNEKGLVVGLHFVNNDYKDEGFIASTIVRILLDQCKNIEEAIALIAKLPHGYGYNYSMTDQSGKAIVVEASPQEQFIRADNPLICTNHFESTVLQDNNRKWIEGSVQRKEYVTSFLKEELSANAAYRHFNDGQSPVFFKDYQAYFGTLHTVVYSPGNLEILVGIGENSEPNLLSLKEYIEGSLAFPGTIMGKIYQEI
ncbi:linear amide C-N hydrolase [Lysinibacillus fusiformis]|nr:linear amide C-N hydrolase [Lysinibacillus fusiformis]